MSALITKITDRGLNNPPRNDKALNLCMLMHNQCPKAYSIFMQNLVGVSNRHLRRLLRDSTSVVKESVLEISNHDMIAARLKKRVELATNALIQQQSKTTADYCIMSGNTDIHKVAYSIAFDGTTVPPVVQACPHAAGIVGMCAPNHIRLPDGDESITSNLGQADQTSKREAS